MLYKLVFFILLAVSQQNIEISYSKVSVNILSKYQPKKIWITLKSGTLDSDGNDERAEGLYSIEAKGTIVVISSGAKKYKSGDVLFSSDTIDVVFLNSGKKEKRVYPGGIRIRSENGLLEIMNICNVESYVKESAYNEIASLLSASGSQGLSLHLLSAMEISVRSFALSREKRHENCNFCDLTHCVSYAGIKKRSIKTETTGIVMTDTEGSIIPAYFHSTCGGVLSSPSLYWPADGGLKNFREGTDGPDEKRWCRKSPHFFWSFICEKDELSSALKTGKIKNIRTDPEKGRVSAVIVTDETSETKIFNISRFMSVTGRAFGWNRIKSNLFTVELFGDDIIFRGKGLGHGIGLCQYGARDMAEGGKSYMEILKYYYNDPQFSKVVYRQEK